MLTTQGALVVMPATWLVRIRARTWSVFQAKKKRDYVKIIVWSLGKSFLVGRRANVHNMLLVV